MRQSLWTLWPSDPPASALGSSSQKPFSSPALFLFLFRATEGPIPFSSLWQRRREKRGRPGCFSLGRPHSRPRSPRCFMHERGGGPRPRWGVIRPHVCEWSSAWCVVAWVPLGRRAVYSWLVCVHTNLRLRAALAAYASSPCGPEAHHGVYSILPPQPLMTRFDVCPGIGSW